MKAPKTTGVAHITQIPISVGASRLKVFSKPLDPLQATVRVNYCVFGES